MADLPTGTVTFLFTDIEGSTARWEQQPEAMRVALARHDALVRAAIVNHGGHVVKTMGDAFHAVFVRAPDAVAAALEAQRRLQAEPWGEIGPIRVRMGVHTGAAEERDGDYYGPPLNRAARIMAAGHGGQILLSQATYELVRDPTLGGITFVDLKEHRLKDLARPERVFQLVVPDLPSQFPALRSLDARPNNLPTHPTALLGRDREVAEVSSLLRGNARLVTLTGPGGTGKTRLSLQVAAEVLEDFEQGVFFVELAPILDPALIPTTIAQALGIRDTGRPIVDALKEHLRNRSLLLVLDNFEQIVAGASVISEILAVSPHLRGLVSSREPLQVRGEYEYAVPPLRLPDPLQPRLPDAILDSPAVALFVQRAQAVRAGFEVTDENASAITEICTQLDGLPLAIELAAARVRLLPPRALAQRLERRLSLLVGGARDLPARQQTLRDTIAWSHDLLDDDERRLFRRLAVFVGGWTLDTAEAVCNPDGDLDILTGLESLVSKSLVKSDEGDGDEPRFRTLETIREFAVERAEACGEMPELRRRHAESFLAVAREAAPRFTGLAGGRWLNRIQAEHDNLRAALAWSVGTDAPPNFVARLAGPLWYFWWRRGYFGEGRRWLDLALGHEADAPTRSEVMLGAGILAFFLEDLVRCDLLLSELEALSRAAGDHAFLIRSLAWNAFNARNMGNYTRAELLGAEAVALGRQTGEPEKLALALLMLGMVVGGQADHTRATELLEEGLHIARREEAAAAWVSPILQNLARAAIGLGHIDRAAALCTEASEISGQRNDTHALEAIERLAMRIARLRGDVVQGAGLTRSNLILNRDLGAWGNVATDFESLAWIARSAGDYTRAAHMLGAADALRESISRPIQAEVRGERDEDLSFTRPALGDAAFEASFAEGRAMPLERAIAYALDQPVRGRSELPATGC